MRHIHVQSPSLFYPCTIHIVQQFQNASDPSWIPKYVLTYLPVSPVDSGFFLYTCCSTERIPWLIDTDGRRTSSVGKNEDWQDDLERLKLSPNLPNNLPEEKPLLGEPFDEDSRFYW